MTRPNRKWLAALSADVAYKQSLQPTPIPSPFLTVQQLLFASVWLFRRIAELMLQIGAGHALLPPAVYGS